jgi:hypothetical protein
VGDGREYPLGFEAIPTTHKRPFVHLQPFVTFFSERTITLTPLSLFLEHSFTANLTRADHVLYTLPSFRLVALSLISPLCRGLLLCGFPS